QRDRAEERERRRQAVDVRRGDEDDGQRDPDRREERQDSQLDPTHAPTGARTRRRNGSIASRNGSGRRPWIRWPTPGNFTSCPSGHFFTSVSASPSLSALPSALCAAGRTAGIVGTAVTTSSCPSGLVWPN